MGIHLYNVAMVQLDLDPVSFVLQCRRIFVEIDIDGHGKRLMSPLSWPSNVGETQLVLLSNNNLWCNSINAYDI